MEAMLTAAAYIASVLFSVSQSALGKAMPKGKRADIYSLNKLFAASIFFSFPLFFGFDIHVPTLMYASLYAVFLSISTVFGLKALISGPMALTSTIVTFSLIFPVTYGFLFLNETITIPCAIGLSALVPTFILLNFKKGSKVKITGKWMAYTLITLCSNGVCSIIQKKHQLLFAGKHLSLFMFFAMLVSFFILLVVSSVNSFHNMKKEKTTLSFKPKELIIPNGLLAGVFNGLANFMTLFLASGENASILFPVISVSTSAAALAVGRFFFGERLSAAQKTGFVLGVLSAALMKF